MRHARLQSVIHVARAPWAVVRAPWAVARAPCILWHVFRVHDLRPMEIGNRFNSLLYRIRIHWNLDAHGKFTMSAGKSAATGDRLEQDKMHDVRSEGPW